MPPVVVKISAKTDSRKISSIMIQDIGIPTLPNTQWVAFTTAGAKHGEAGAQVWLSTEAPYTPQMGYASGQVGSVGADINAVDANGETAMHAAALKRVLMD